MGWYLRYILEDRRKWKRMKTTVLVCGRCHEVDRAEKVEAEGKCPFCGFGYERGCEQ
jgi:uncharacterized CHY-type Zn-finger protein